MGTDECLRTRRHTSRPSMRGKSTSKHDEVWCFEGALDGAGAVAANLDFKALVLEFQLKHPGDVRIVLDDQYPLLGWPSRHLGSGFHTLNLLGHDGTLH